MNILFACGDLEKNLHASNKIIIQLAQSLVRQGHSCTVAGICSCDYAFNSNVDGVDLVRLNSSHICDRAFLEMENFVRSCNGDRASARKGFYLAHPVYSAALMYRYGISKKSSFSEKSYSQQLNSLVDKIKPDAVVVSYMPFMHAYEFVKNFKADIPFITYQLDPWGLHCGEYFARDKELHTAQELELFSRCSAVITTPVLLRQYSHHPQYQPFTHKMTALNFPNVKPFAPTGSESAFVFEDDAVNLLFCGVLEDGMRSPDYLLQQLEKIYAQKNIKFKMHFLGKNNTPTLLQILEDCPWAVYGGTVCLEKAFETMAQADILVNIGNTYNNQVPSKIFDYLSFGKPVLNVEKIADCPAREYFDRYPLSLTLQEHSSAEQTNALAEFISTAKKHSMPYTKIEQLFGDCTLNYATDVFCDIINRI